MRIVLIGFGILVACSGVLFALQGFGVLEGSSPMVNTTEWSILGPIIALAGVAIAGFGVRMRN